MSKRRLYFGFSIVVILIGLFSIYRFGFRFGLDFTGGVIAQYKIPKQVENSEIADKLSQKDLTPQSISKTGDQTYLLRFSPLPFERKEEISDLIKEIDENSQELRYEVVGATFGPELIKKTVFALVAASLAILVWIAFQFKSIKFGASAVLAMLHDSLVLVGLYTLLGKLYGAEIDFLFVTAVLTTLSFSVHDTIVVYDRIRETIRKEGGEFYDVANRAVGETMVRSLNNSFTIMFMLFALILLGGETIRWFAFALMIGTVSGTYSSPFVAVPILVSWDEAIKKLRKNESTS